MDYKNISLYKWLKRSQTIYFLKVRLFNKDYKEYKKKLYQSSKSREQIKREMNLVKDYWKCKPLHYIRYQLFEKELSDEQLLDYIPPYYFYNFYKAKLRQESTNTDIYNNKINSYYYLTEKGINTPDIISIIEKGRFLTKDKKDISLAKILENIGNEEKLFFKPIFGCGGIGIIVLSKKNNQLSISGKAISINDIDKHIDKSTTYIVQKGIKQRKDISEINPSSVNTLRVVTQWRKGNPQLSVCVLRIGRNGKDVDNSHQGGISVQINTENGFFFPYAIAEHGGGQFPMHPDTQYVFNGNKINNWKHVKETIISFAEKTPELKEIAWDIAITETDITAIEINNDYGIDHLQCCCGGLRRVLNVFPIRNE